MRLQEELASQRTRSAMELAEQLRYPRRLRAMRRAQRLERRARRRVAAARRQAAEFRAIIESLDY
jgi:hypothetical protein